MEFKSLFLGITFTIGVFALKSGVGLHYFLIKRKEVKTKLFFLMLFGLVYFLIFALSFYILQEIDIVQYFDRVQDFLKSGMFIHILIAGGLIIWAIALLSRRDRVEKRSFGWVALVVPCPLCITVIFFSMAFLLSFFPHSGHMAVVAAYAGFMAIVIVTIVTMTLWENISGSAPESNLGAAMLIIAAYFLLSVIIMPQFGDIDRIYRLAAYQGEKEIMNTRDILMLYSIMASLFATGFTAMRRKIRGEKNWT
ncbi:MAG: DUF2162 domain-containing protein [Deltaproteobacteria bacterium]|nr:DUF2162 domain-containing protein [Deltaproteobacteria bacterium]